MVKGMRMKKNIMLVFALFMVISLVSCGKPVVSNSLMRDAAPSTSALALYTYRGDDTRRVFLYLIPTWISQTIVVMT